jgi:hypothetical protein
MRQAFKRRADDMSAWKGQKETAGLPKQDRRLALR